MAIVNNYTPGSISLDDLNRAMGNTGYKRHFESHNTDSNRYAYPEIKTGDFITCGGVTVDRIEANSVLASKLTVTESKMKNTENPGYYTARDPRDRLIVDFDEAKWEIDVPGVESSDIEVYTVKDVVTVKVAGSGKHYGFERKLQLLEGEKITTSKLALGVLTITIDRPHKKVLFEVA